MGEKRRRFTEFKREAVRLAFSGGQPVSQVARELDVQTDMLVGGGGRWPVKVHSRRSPSGRCDGCVGS
jgi:hypothetical protein